MNPWHILTNSKLEGDHESLLACENDNKQVCLAILSIWSIELFDVYWSTKHAKEIWDKMNKKCILEDVRTQKYVIRNFKSFQSTKDNMY